MKAVSLAQELSGTSYPGRGIVIGKSADGKYAVTAYFIMGTLQSGSVPGMGMHPVLFSARKAPASRCPLVQM